MQLESAQAALSRSEKLQVRWKFKYGQMKLTAKHERSGRRNAEEQVRQLQSTIQMMQMNTGMLGGQQVSYGHAPATRIIQPMLMPTTSARFAEKDSIESIVVPEYME